MGQNSIGVVWPTQDQSIAREAVTLVLAVSVALLLMTPHASYVLRWWLAPLHTTPLGRLIDD